MFVYDAIVKARTQDCHARYRSLAMTSEKRNLLKYRIEQYDWTWTCNHANCIDR